MRVDQVVVAGRAGRLGAEHPGGERAELAGKLLLGEPFEGAGGDVPDVHAGRHLDHRGQVTGGGPGEDLHLDVGLRQPTGDLQDVDVHASRVARAGLVQGRGVHGEGGDAAGPGPRQVTSLTTDTGVQFRHVRSFCHG